VSVAPLSIAYLGDAASAAAFALAGVAAEAPAPGAERSAFERACTGAHVVLLGARCAAALPADVLARALASLAPLVAIVPDPAGTTPLPDAARRVRRELGIEA